MKKCTAIIFYSALFFLFSCSGKHTDNTHSGFENESIAMSIKDTIKIDEKYSYAYADKDAPALTVEMSLPIVELNNAAATARIDSTLAMYIFGESSTLKDACYGFINGRKTDFDELHDEYINSKDNDVPAFFFSLYDIIGATVQVGYKDCITYFVVHEEYNGGAHPNTFISITNFDPNSGNEITLNDIFKEGHEEQLIAILTEQLMKENNAATIEELRDQGFLFFDTEMFISNNFALEKESITFLYNPYEIACYAMGHIYVTLDYKSLEEIMK